MENRIISLIVNGSEWSRGTKDSEVERQGSVGSMPTSKTSRALSRHVQNMSVLSLCGSQRHWLFQVHMYLALTHLSEYVRAQRRLRLRFPAVVLQGPLVSAFFCVCFLCVLLKSKGAVEAFEVCCETVLSLRTAESSSLLRHGVH